MVHLDRAPVVGAEPLVRDFLDRRAGARVSSQGAAHGQVAQLVEQGTENPRVGGSSPSLATMTSLEASPFGRGFLAC